MIILFVIFGGGNCLLKHKQHAKFSQQSLSTILSVTFLFATKLKKYFHMIRLSLFKFMESECYCSKVKLLIKVVLLKKELALK